MKRKTLFLLGILGVGMTLCGGCLVVAVGGAAAAGAGTVAYLRGELQTTVDASLERAVAASQQALKDLKMPVTAEERDGISGRITARAAGDKKVVIRTRKVTGTATELGIRVGTWGEETMSHQILDRIKQHL